MSAGIVLPGGDPVPDEPNDRVRNAARRLHEVVGEPAAVDQLAAALAALTPSSLCTLCVLEIKQSRMVGRVDPEVHPGVVMANGMMLCEVRHTINAGAPALQIAQPGQIPGGLG